EPEGDLTTALLLDFPIHLLHDVHPGCAFRGQGGKFDHHRFSQARPCLEAHTTHQHEQRPVCPSCTTHMVSSLQRKSSSMRRSSRVARDLATALSNPCSGNSVSGASRTCCKRSVKSARSCTCTA